MAVAVALGVHHLDAAQVARAQQHLELVQRHRRLWQVGPSRRRRLGCGGSGGRVGRLGGRGGRRANARRRVHRVAQPLDLTDGALHLLEQLGALEHAAILVEACAELLIRPRDLRLDALHRLRERLHALVAPQQLALDRVRRVHVGQQRLVLARDALAELLAHELQAALELRHEPLGVSRLNRRAHERGRVEVVRQQRRERRCERCRGQCRRVRHEGATDRLRLSCCLP
jgi:hypothetical protein